MYFNFRVSRVKRLWLAVSVAARMLTTRESSHFIYAFRAVCCRLVKARQQGENEKRIKGTRGRGRGECTITIYRSDEREKLRLSRLFRTSAFYLCRCSDASHAIADR